MDFNSIFISVQQFLTIKSWVLQVFLVVFITFLAYLIEGLAYRRLHPKAANSKTIWDEVLIEAIHKPLRVFIWVSGLRFAAAIAHKVDQSVSIFKAFDKLHDAAVIILLVWFLVRFISFSQEKVLARKVYKLDKTSVNALGQILRVSIIITGSLIVLQTLGYSITGLLALGGASTIVVGLAAKDMMSNFFGGLMIYFDRPFAIGDWVRSPDRSIEGTVEHIGWRLTRIRTFDKRPLYVPNGVFSNITVENPSRMTNRRIFAKVGLRYEDAAEMATILKDIEAMLNVHAAIDTKQTLMVNLIEFGESSLIFMIYAFTKTTDWVQFQSIQQDVFLKVIEIITQHGAQCAFPTSTVFVPDSIKVKYDNS